MPGREHDVVGMQRAAIVQPQLKTLRGRFDRGNTRVQELRKRRLLTARQRTQRVLDVVTVDPALREIPVAYCETTTAAPAHEMIWVLGEEAHAVGARVEQVLGTVRTVRDAAAETFVRFDQGDVEMIGSWASRCAANAAPLKPAPTIATWCGSRMRQESRTRGYAVSRFWVR